MAHLVHASDFGFDPVRPGEQAMTQLFYQQCDNQPVVPMYRAIRILIADDHSLVRKGIMDSLSCFADLEVVGEASTGEEAVLRCQELHPDVVLMDLIMPGLGGVAATRFLHEDRPEIHIIALTSSRDGELVEAALEAGAVSYLLKDIPEEELARSIHLAHQSVPSLAPEAGQALVELAKHNSRRLGYDLTDRERQVLALMARGLSNEQIGDQLSITPATVKFHARRIRSKLGTASRIDTILLAMQHRLVSLGQDSSKH
jgi:NarL family two-component system response regulator LiaR